MKKIMKRKIKGFSLVELLAVVVILGIIISLGIATTSVLVERARQSKIDSDKNAVSMAAQSYIQNNKNLVPKLVGESTKIKVSDLRSNNYLTEDITNSKGESCMENSYVRVYKLSNSEYIYTTYLYCGGEEAPEVENVPKPVVSGTFTDSSGEAKLEKLNNVSDAYLFIELDAAKAKDKEDYKNQNSEIKLDGYSFKIFVVKDNKLQEAYNSGSLSAGREDKILINKKLTDYIDVTGVTEVALEITAVNTLGGATTVHKAISENGQKDKLIYDDNIRPNCIPPSSPYDEADWVNKKEYNTSKNPRKLTVGCDDGTGSGCTRNYFTKSWPNTNDEFGAEYVYIQVKDNADNVSCSPNEGCSVQDSEICKFRVNVDIKAPTATVTAHVGKESGNNDSDSLTGKHENTNVLIQKVVADDSDMENEIKPTDKYYDKLVGNETEDKWMNKENFPHGVVYKIVLKDNIRLDKWTWETNAGHIDTMKNKNYLKVSDENPEASSGMVPQNEEHGSTVLHGSTDETVYVRFLTEGMRYGVFKAYDKAGNSIEIKIAAHLDRTAPPVPETLNAYLYDKVRENGTKVTQNVYNYATWSNKYVRVETGAGQNRDNLSKETTLSGFWKYYYDARNYKDKSVGEEDYGTYLSSGKGIYDFKGDASIVDGKNKIRFKGCDKANNCSEYGTYKEVWIDITIPKCNVEKSITKGDESEFGWLGIGETARVTATCTDDPTENQSGCTETVFYHDYNSPINTTNAGAKGNKKGGQFQDYAGNIIECSASKTIKIDYVKPTCTVSGGSKTWTNKNKTIKGTCSDTGGSGCKGSIEHEYTEDIETDVAGPAGNNKGGTVSDKADNIVACAANQSVYLDKTKPTIVWDPAPGTYNHDVSDKRTQVNISATCQDNLSKFDPKHPTYYHSSYPVPTTKSGKSHEHCCVDKAGNSHCETKKYYATHYHEDSSCGVKEYNVCETSACGVKEYKSCRNSSCEVDSYKSCRNKACGVDYYEWTCSSDLAGTRIFKKYSYDHPYGGRGYCGKSGTIYNSCTTSACGVKEYKSCPAKTCGVKYYKTCADKACGVKEYYSCDHYRPCDKLS